MEYIFLFLVGWVVVCLPALFYASVVDGRRRRDADEFTQRILSLSRQVDALERRLASASQAASVAGESARTTPQHSPAPMVVATIAPPSPPPVVSPVRLEPAIKPGVEPVALTPAATPAPAQTSVPPVLPTLEKRVMPQVGREPVAPEPTVKPPVPPIAPAPVKPSVTTPPAASAPPRETQPAPADAAARVQAPPPPAATAPPRPAAPATVPPPSFAQISRPIPSFKSPELKKRSFSIEEALGANWGPRVGIAFVVIGVALFVGSQWSHFAPWLRLLIVYASGFGAGFGFVAGGIFLDKKEQYRILGRCLIGGGWAVNTLMTYVLSHGPFAVLSSQRVDLVLLLAVIGAMVWHTLRYDSQLVTGAGFLLGFTAIALNPDPPFNLIAGALLIAGMTVIVLRRRWYELEVFGILAAYLNHFYWLNASVFTQRSPGQPFPEYTSSVALLVTYWAVFRVSYLLRKISGPDQERVSTVAGLLNPVMLMALLKFQSFHPEWTFAALLAMGAVEFTLGQLPIARRRVQPFYVLSSFGALLMLSAFPIRYSGDKLELIWLTGAEAFLIAGILTRERLFRGFGLTISSLVALYAIPVRILPLVDRISAGQPHRDLQLGLVLGILAVVLYLNAHVAGRVWRQFFVRSPETETLTALSFAAALLAVSAVFSAFNDNLVAMVLALLLICLSWLGRRFSISALIFESHAIAAVAFVQVMVAGLAANGSWYGVPQRVVMFSAVAVSLYLSSRMVRSSQARDSLAFSAGYAAAGSTLLAVLIWQQAPAWSVIMLWVLLGVVLVAAAELFKRNDFKWQALALVIAASVRAFIVNFELTATTHHVSYRSISVAVAAAGIYLLGRWSPMKALRPVYSLAGTVLLSWLAYLESPQPWAPVAWIGLALMLAVAARLWEDKALLWQTHSLAVLAAGWTFAYSFAPEYRATRAQLITVGITTSVLYALTWITNIAAIIDDERICQFYSWAGSLLVSWLMWYQLDPAFVSLAWCALGFILFEAPDNKWFGLVSKTSMRAQAYVALVSSFAHIFYANFNTPASGTLMQILSDVRVLTILPLPPVFYWVYWRLNSEEQRGKETSAAAKAASV
ncbi:MAG TPA: hypothetical protein VE783_10360 [Candidatus Limnocylindrales bacterium]|nr:hypothetical protein [Candidatus Limnocylindrales bacterium]